jgi:hypothetical protein
MEKDTDKKVQELCEWMKDNSFDIESNQNLKLVNSANKFEGRCVLARREIKTDTPLVEIPLKFLINYKHALSNPDLVDFFEWYHSSDLLLDNLENKLTRLDALYFILIITKFETGSFLEKFVNSMPVVYDTPEYFPQDLINALPCYLKYDIQLRLSKFKSKFNFISKLLVEYLSVNKSNTSIQILCDHFKYEEFRWAFCSVNSRCFHMEEADVCDESEIALARKYFGKLAEKYESDSFFFNCESLEDFNFRCKTKTITMNSLCCIVPYLDFLNHSFEANAHAFLDKDNSVYVLKTKSEDEWFDESGVVLKPNDQVYITYGHHDNKTLLIEYGFTLEENVYDRIIFRFEDFMRFVNDKSEKKEILWRKAIDERLHNDLSCNKADGPSWNLLRLFDLIVHLNKNQISSDQDLEAYDSYEIKYTNKVRELILEFFESYEVDFDRALEGLSELKVKNESSYHISMCHNLTRIYSDMIKFNIDICKDNTKWFALF